MLCYDSRPAHSDCAAQFYLGTTRLQLEHKGDANGYTYTGIANVVPAFGFLGIPVISWLLDKQARARDLACSAFANSVGFPSFFISQFDYDTCVQRGCFSGVRPHHSRACA